MKFLAEEMGSSRVLISYDKLLVRSSFVLMMLLGIAHAGVQFSYSDHLGSVSVMTVL